jgi:glutamine amidotransferase
MNVFKQHNIEARAAKSADELTGASRVILPGVGAFDHAMERLEESGMRTCLEDLALEQKVPVLGVCVGMQMLANGSDEGNLPGLGWIEGRVRSFTSWAPAEHIPVPHMGWNDVQPVADTSLFDDLESDSRFYFLHSFFFDCARADDVLAVANYGGDFSCAVRRENIYGVQFHPEKSHHFGTRLLKNFARL